MKTLNKDKSVIVLSKKSVERLGIFDKKINLNQPKPKFTYDFRLNTFVLIFYSFGNKDSASKPDTLDLSSKYNQIYITFLNSYRKPRSNDKQL